MHSFDWLTWQLADSAFPTGGFAHSWGLEAAWQMGEIPDAAALRRFVYDVLQQSGRAALPWLTAAHRDPSRLVELDSLADVFLTNAVANRASRVQGTALASTCARVWPVPAMTTLETQARACFGHYAPVAGGALRALDVPLAVAQRLLLYNGARGVLAAAVRLGIVGSYEAQRLQHGFAPVMDAIVEKCGSLDDRNVAQTAPIIDLLQATHDRLYSRLFQS
jgi:urease accessory protein